MLRENRNLVENSGKGVLKAVFRDSDFILGHFAYICSFSSHGRLQKNSVFSRFLVFFKCFGPTKLWKESIQGFPFKIVRFISKINSKNQIFQRFLFTNYLSTGSSTSSHSITGSSTTIRPRTHFINSENDQKSNKVKNLKKNRKTSFFFCSRPCDEDEHIYAKWP